MTEEQKAYDLKKLMDHLKDQGLELAEDAAEKVYNGVMNWVEESAKVSKNPIDDIVILVRKQIDGIVLPQIDKIDGHEG